LVVSDLLRRLSFPDGVHPAEAAGVDGHDRVRCRLDLLQAEFSKVTEQAVNVVLIIEGTAAHPPDAKVFAEAIDLVTRHCGGTGEVVAYPCC